MIVIQSNSGLDQQDSLTDFEGNLSSTCLDPKPLPDLPTYWPQKVKSASPPYFEGILLGRVWIISIEQGRMTECTNIPHRDRARFQESSILAQLRASPHEAYAEKVQFVMRPIEQNQYSQQLLAELRPDLHRASSVDEQELEVGIFTSDSSIPTARIDQNHFIEEIIRLFEEERVEDGFVHPAENLLRKALREYPSSALSEIKNAFYDHLQTHPDISASLLECLGGLMDLSIDEWAFPMAVSALQCNSIELREAGVRFFEIRGGKAAIDALLEHLPAESIPWMKSYIEGVIADISE